MLINVIITIKKKKLLVKSILTQLTSPDSIHFVPKPIHLGKFFFNI